MVSGNREQSKRELIESFLYSPDHQQIGQVLETQDLWGEVVCRVWLPDSDAVVRIPAARLLPVEAAGSNSPEGIAYIAAAGRVLEALTQDVLLAPIGASIIPLPHQIRALARAMSHERIRYLLADEVGLGKTIEAGLIMLELKLRGLVRRTLVVAPKGLVSQWVSELRLHFGEKFQLVLPEDLKSLRRLADLGDGELATANSWRSCAQAVVPMDSVKPLEKRRGWSAAQVAEYNRERFEDLISAGWDLVIVDEAHRLGGSTEQVARFKLGQGLAEAAPYLLLLSATPHQGKTDAFQRLLSLLDARAFPDLNSVTRERVQPYVIRTEKRRAIDVAGQPLFKPRSTTLFPVAWEERHRSQQLLYQLVTEYVRVGYNQAMREKRNYIGFLMLLMQRLVVSSTRAIRTALERRLAALAEPQEQLSLFTAYSEEEWADLDGQEQAEILLGSRFKALKNERVEVKRLLEAAVRCEQIGPDAKAEALLEWIYRLQAEERDPGLKVLLFTEFVPTQEMLREFLLARGFFVACLNGSMDMDERRRVQEEFAGEARILISTEAGGEGLNLQFCHVVINYDIPWNPMRIEQRIGRVDRIGQNQTVRAVNFFIEESVEYRVREVLEEKLAVIFQEFGIDKTGDVLDSAQAGRMFDELFVEAILHPEQVEASVTALAAQMQEQIREARASNLILGSEEELEPQAAQQLLAHPLPYWVERMTLSYVQAHGGRVERKEPGWTIAWPDGEVFSRVVFSAKEAEAHPASRQLTLEEPKLRRLAQRLPRWVPGMAIPVVALSGISREIQGYWSLWQIGLQAPVGQRRRIIPIFITDAGQAYAATARAIWERLLAEEARISSRLPAERSAEVFAMVRQSAEEQGSVVYQALRLEHLERLDREREKAEYGFAARRAAIERIGLPQVRNHRLRHLEQEERAWREHLKAGRAALPELLPLLLVRIEGKHE